MILPHVTLPDAELIMMLKPLAPPAQVQVQVDDNAEGVVVHQAQAEQGMLRSHAHYPVRIGQCSAC